MKHFFTVGQRFTLLTVIRREQRGGWLCRCDCGAIKTIRGSNLATGARRSCGRQSCQDVLRGNHGHSPAGKSPTYKAWCAMFQRCNNPNDRKYEHYGARGIKVCERWLSFINFLADMGERPDGLSLERENNSLGYSPDNCRWATWAEQNRNRRTNRLLTKDGLTKCLKDWALETGLSQSGIRNRLRKGWTVEQALSTRPFGRTLAAQLRAQFGASS